jgi:hypothetical protein
MAKLTTEKPVKQYTNELISSGRIVSASRIEDLSEGFELPGQIPFSLYIRPLTASADEMDTLLSVRCQQMDTLIELPFTFYEWNVILLTGIAPGDDTILSNFELYWGAGIKIKDV